MIVQYTAAALASENKVLAHPSSADSIPTSANQEDHVSMGAAAARHAWTVLGHVQQIVGIELLCAAQALDLRLEALGGAGGPDAPDGEGTPRGADHPGRAPVPGKGVAEALARIRDRVAVLREDREPGLDLGSVLALVREGALVDLVAPG